MPKHVLVALPLSDAQRSALQASVPEYEFTFAQTETVTLTQVLEAEPAGLCADGGAGRAAQSDTE